MEKGRILIALLTITLAAMILLSFSLHLFELLHIEEMHPFYDFFWSFPDKFSYDFFWTVYWGAAFILICRQGVLIYREFRRRVKPKESMNP